MLLSTIVNLNVLTYLPVTKKLIVFIALIKLIM